MCRLVDIQTPQTNTSRDNDGISWGLTSPTFPFEWPVWLCSFIPHPTLNTFHVRFFYLVMSSLNLVSFHVTLSSFFQYFFSQIQHYFSISCYYDVTFRYISLKNMQLFFDEYWFSHIQKYDYTRTHQNSITICQHVYHFNYTISLLANVSTFLTSFNYFR